MSAFTYNFTVEQNASRNVQFIWKTSEALPVDLSGYTAKMQMRHTKSAEEVQATLTTENGGIILGGTAGTIILVFSDELTRTLTRDGYYDVLLYSGDDALRFVEGKITLSKGVTRNG